MGNVNKTRSISLIALKKAKFIKIIICQLKFMDHMTVEKLYRSCNLTLVAFFREPFFRNFPSMDRWHSLRVIGLIIVSIILLLCLFTLSRLLISLLFRLFLQFFSLFLSQFSRLFSLFSGGFLRLFYFFLSLLFLFSFLSTLLPTFATRRSLFFGGRFWFGFDSLLVG